jgi:hypothetical protein
MAGGDAANAMNDSPAQSRFATRRQGTAAVSVQPPVEGAQSGWMRGQVRPGNFRDLPLRGFMRTFGTNK